jgi:hypothetical protein
MTEHEKRARKLALEYAYIRGLAWTTKEAAFRMEHALSLALKEAFEAGHREAEEALKLKETIAYKCGYDSGRNSVIAEVMTSKEEALKQLWDRYRESTSQIPPFEQSGMSYGFIRGFEDGCGWLSGYLLAKLNAEGEKT